MKTIGNLTKDAIIRAVASEALTVTQAIGTEVTMNSGSTTGFAAAFDSNTGKVVVAFSDGTDGSKGKAIVGTVDSSNNSISFGSEVVFQNSEITADQMDCVFDSNANKVVIFYTDTNNPSTNDRTGTAIVGTVSGTSISFGTKAAFESGNTQHINACFDSNANKFVVAYKDAGNSDYGTAAVGTVSGTDISFGTPVVIQSGNTSNIAAEFDSSQNKVVIAYRDQAASQQATAVVGTVSGTSISFGSEVVVSSSAASMIELVFDSSNNKMVIFYADGGNSDRGTAHVGTVSGTSISFGSAAIFNTGQSEYTRGVYDTEAGKIAIVYKDGGNSNRPTFISGTVSGTDISFDTETVMKAVEGVTILPGVAYDSTNKRVVAAYLDSTGSDNGLAQVIRTGYSSASGGTISAGAPVIVNANGTVSSVSQSSVSAVTGTKAVFESAESNFTRIAYDPVNDKMLIIYCDAGDSGKGKCVVATISGTSITYGSVTTFHNANTNFADVIYDTNAGKFVIVYYDGDNSGYGTSVVATVSGSSVSFGSHVVFNSANVNYANLIYHAATQKVVVSYRTTSDQGKSQVGTVSGTSISWGSQYIYNSGTTGPAIHSSYDEASENFIVAYKDEGNSSYGTARVGSISGTAITWGSETVFNAGSTDNISTVYDPTVQKIMIYYRDIANNSYGTAIVGTISGTAVTFGSEQVLNSGNTTNTNILHHPDAGYNVIVYRDAGDGNIIRFATATISGTTITFGSETQLNGEQGYYHDQAWDPVNKKIIIVYRASSNSDHGTAVAYTPDHNASNLTSENFIGITSGPILDTTTGEILSSCNVARNLTSLTPGQTYFVTGAGALSLTAGSPSVTAGTAISSTELIVKG